MTIQPDSPRTARLLVLTDLDGTLLAPDTYAFDAAQPALRALRERNIPVLLVSSKTRAELESFRERLDNRHPFVSENGGAVFIPIGTFEMSCDRGVLRGGYQVIEFGTPYTQLRMALAKIAVAVGCELKGFGDMSVAEIMASTGLSECNASLAKQREYDEPFLIVGRTDPGALRKVRRHAELQGLRCTTGGRFHHLMGPHDKGLACRYLIQCYRRQYGAELLTIALGDAPNDIAMLSESDRPVLVQTIDGGYAPAPQVPNLLRADGIGPIGWNRAVLALLAATR